MPHQLACLRGCVVTLVAFVFLFSTVRFQMHPQIACPGRCKVTLVAFFRLFPTVYFQMRPQITCRRRCKIALVASVRLFSIMQFQMCLQRCCPGWRKFTLAALVCPFSTMHFHMLLNITKARWVVAALATLLVGFPSSVCFWSGVIHFNNTFVGDLLHRWLNCENLSLQQWKSESIRYIWDKTGFYFHPICLTPSQTCTVDQIKSLLVRTLDIFYLDLDHCTSDISSSF